MLFLMLTAVAAPTTPLAPPTPAPAVRPAEKPVCRAGATPIGSMLPGKRVCHSRSDWAAIDAANQRNADLMADRAGHRAAGRD